jgi:lipoprotein-anchoring transpeptidase ErfK/SrfK
MKTISRRDFLKLGGLTLASLAFTSFLPETTQFEDIDLVRVATVDPKGVVVHKEPTDESQTVRNWERDSLIHVYETVQVETHGNNPHWYRVYGGYMNAARLQKVRVHYNVPLSIVPATKLLSELTVPYTDSYRYDKWNGWSQYFRLYYSSTQWITDVDTGPDGKAWYVVQDEADKNSHYYVPTVQLRPISPEEFTPLSPDVPMGKKRIDVNLTMQTLTCYEYDRVFFTTQVSTGVPGLMATPTGSFNIQDKLPSRNMSTSSPLADDVIPLVGVPWTSFIFFQDRPFQGHAFHGTYWHDNFGVPMSHGCVNMRNEDALRLFRWSQPAAAFEDINKATLDVKGNGTFGDVHY